MIRSIIAAATLTAVTVFTGTTAADASANIQDGPISLTVLGDGLVVHETISTYASHGGEAQVQAYYLILAPDGRSKKIYSDAVQQGMGPGVYRDSYGPTGGFLDGTRLCAGWWDPTGKVTIPGLPCATIHS